MESWKREEQNGMESVGRLRVEIVWKFKTQKKLEFGWRMGYADFKHFISRATGNEIEPTIAQWKYKTEEKKPEWSRTTGQIHKFPEQLKKFKKQPNRKRYKCLQMNVIYELPEDENNLPGDSPSSVCNPHLFIFENMKQIWNVKRNWGKMKQIAMRDEESLLFCKRDLD
jgi:hypothetical protein